MANAEWRMANGECRMANRERRPASIADYRAIADRETLEQEGLFVAEGRLVVERLLDDARFRLHSILLTSTAAAAMRTTLERRPDVQLIVADPEQIRAVTGFNFHRGCLALAYRHTPEIPFDELVTHSLILAIEGVGNPDNIGGLFRSALALGAGAVLLDATAGDPLYRKAIRTSMAATLRVPYSRETDLSATLARLRTRGYRVVALTPAEAAISIDEVELDRDARLVILVGSEGNGVSASAFAQSDLRVRIPVDSRADSLNVVAAASIALHALRRR
jgi:tRNA G18 (ribose-2'-O)-methylase SpoU